MAPPVISTKKAINRIAICGAGIGGLALAAVINQHCDVFVDVYEAKPEVSAIGAAIAIWKRSWQVLQNLGLEEEIMKRGIPLPKDGQARGPIFRKSGQEEIGFDFHNHMMPYGPTVLARPVLVDLLKSRLSDKCTIHTSKKLIDYRVEPSQAITMIFEDGSTASVDVLVGADGVHSKTRAAMYRALASSAPNHGYGKFCEPIWSGTYAYRANVNFAKFKALYPDHQVFSQPKIWCGKNKHVVSHPLPCVGVINLICFYTVETGEGTPYHGPWVTKVSKKVVINCYKDWEPELVQLLEHLENPSRWAIHVVPPLPLGVSERVALIGDAAHAMTPHQGVGGGQAIEDAHILGRLLSHRQATIDNIEDVLLIYQQIRLPPAQRAAELSRICGLMYEFNRPDFILDPGNTSARDLEILSDAIGDSLKWLGQGGVDEDWVEAESLLDSGKHKA